jgi:N6-adenosine-specific RNA methylase IME4
VWWLWSGKWGLSYGTMSNDEIIDIDVGCLSDKGFIFLWVINSQIEFGFKCLQKWGYTYVDRVRDHALVLLLFRPNKDSTITECR